MGDGGGGRYHPAGCSKAGGDTAVPVKDRPCKGLRKMLFTLKRF